VRTGRTDDNEGARNCVLLGHHLARSDWFELVEERRRIADRVCMVCSLGSRVVERNFEWMLHNLP
jgi:hypothetical protein